uniref:Uncharacterized protein n=1 Tax=Arion vulgaris TaxID=1028688 RepID=A0A0B6ZTI2_9EUPU
MFIWGGQNDHRFISQKNIMNQALKSFKYLAVLDVVEVAEFATVDIASAV